jgi:hypothetical protein
VTDEPMPEGMTKKHLRYLDQLRESGETNMFGACPYLERKYGIDHKTASAYLRYWRHTFGERHPKE